MLREVELTSVVNIKILSNRNFDLFVPTAAAVESPVIYASCFHLCNLFAPLLQWIGLKLVQVLRELIAYSVPS